LEDLEMNEVQPEMCDGLQRIPLDHIEHGQAAENAPATIVPPGR
jgi:hypothetical protein